METSDTKIHWGYIVGFYVFAFALSAPVQFGYFSEQYQALFKGTIIDNLTYLPAGIGTLLAGVLALSLDKTYTKTITFWGNDKAKNLVISLVPLIIFTLMGLPNKLGWNVHYYAFLISIIILIYSFCEEIFWRGYLLDALNPLGKYLNPLLLGILWWAWHCQFDINGFTYFLIAVIISAFLIGKFVGESRSFLTSSALHALVTTAGGLEQNFDDVKYSMLIIILVWLAIGKWWKPFKA